MAGLDLYLNAARVVVSSGGTTAPAVNTSESWTVASSALFTDPQGRTAATGVTQFRVVDEADTQVPPEIMTVTNVSGTTWTVTRGQEGTTPVAHTAGFTVRAIITSGGISVPAPSPQPFDVGLSAWTLPLTIGGTIAQATQGRPMWSRIRCQPGLVSTMTFGVMVALATAGTGNEVGLYDASGTLLSKSADLSTTMNSQGYKSVALATPQLLAGGYYYCAWMSVGTTAASLLGAAGNTTAGMFTGLGTTSTRLAYQGITTVSALPTSVTYSALTATANVTFFGLS